MSTHVTLAPFVHQVRQDTSKSSKFINQNTLEQHSATKISNMQVTIGKKSHGMQGKIGPLATTIQHISKCQSLMRHNSV
jgi:hypothetical protein